MHDTTLAGGCDSPVRAGKAVGGTPFVQTRGSGAYAYDEAGARFVDYVMAYGPLLFGHAHPAFSSGLDTLARTGTLFGSTHGEEVRLAERIRAHVPSMERIRFTTTGTEAVMSAVRVARAYTRRPLVLRFGGNYHGHSDLALLGAGASAETADALAGGIPAAASADIALARYNDLSSVDAVLSSRERQLAAILVEPIVGNMGLVLPEPGFLEGLAERARCNGALVIFDEVISWLRLGLGGAQARVGIVPDLTTVGKILGGGFPIAAFGGNAEVMRVLAPHGSVFTGGTHAGNPFCVAMAHRTLDLLEERPDFYVQMNAIAERLAEGLRAMFRDLQLPYVVLQLESIVDFKFRSGRVRNYDDARASDARLFARYYHEMRARKILLPPSQNEVMFVSTAHTEADVDETLAAAREALERMAETVGQPGRTLRTG